MRAFFSSLGAALGVVLLGCGPSTLQTGPTMPTAVEIGGAARQVRSFTDLDRVRDVAVSPHHVAVATDRGVLLYPAGPEPEAQRVTRNDGLPSDDATAVAAVGPSLLLVTTAEGAAELEVRADGTAVAEAVQAPPVGRVMDLAIADDETRWACGARGVARSTSDGWERVGEPAQCVRLVTSPEGDVWVGTTEGAWRIEGEVVREHAARHAVPGSYVRDMVPLGGGKVLALVQDTSGAQLAHFDGERWYGYTIDEFDQPLVGLAARGTNVVLITPGYAYAVGPEGDTDGVPLTMLTRSERHVVRSYEAPITPASQVPSDASDASEADELLRAPAKPAAVPTGHRQPEAPRFNVRPLSEAAEDAYLVRRDGPTIYVADRNGGVLELPARGSGRQLRSFDLVPAEDLQVASDRERHPWIVTDAGQLGRWRDGGLERVAAPQGVAPQAIADGPQGAYMAALLEDEPGAVRVYRLGAQGFTPIVERTLELETELLAVPFMGVDDDEQFWLALRVRREQGEGERMRGVAVLTRQSEEVVYHHRGANRERDGEGALSMPDEIASIDLRDPGMAWFASLSGALRVGNHQAVQFGEARGVRGELVTDVAVGEGRVWIAAAEGLGYYESGNFDFNLPPVAAQARPTAVTTDAQGRVWAVGERGAIFHDGERWQRLSQEQGLPTDTLRDVELDAHGRVWLLAQDQVLLLD